MSNTCHQCGDDLKYLAMARLIIEIDGLEFCSEFCVYEWMDGIDEKRRIAGLSESNQTEQ